MVLRGGARASTPTPWTDEMLQARCTKQDGSPWDVLVERQNRITHNDRLPLMKGWDWCDFLHNYTKPE